MNPRQDAADRIGERCDPRVLEPSPPAVSEPPWFADDPVARGDLEPGRTVVSPVPTGDITWVELAAGDPELGAWCADRWLGPYKRLVPAPGSLVMTRRSLHRLAERVMSAARSHANGKIGLRYTYRGFGTPFFGADVQVRVVGAELIVHERGVERRAPISTLDAAADHVGRDELPDDVELGAEPLAVDPRAAVFLGDLYGFAASVLEELRAGFDADGDSSGCSCGPSTSISRCSSARRTPGHAPPTGCRPETSCIPSHTCTWRRGRLSRRGSCGRPASSRAPSCPTPG